MGLVRPQLSLDLRPTFIPKTISNFLEEVSPIGNVSDKVTKLDSFMKRLEEEMKKIDAFKRELPLCMILLNDAIVALKEESMQCKGRNVEPVLEEFIPLKINKENINHREDDDDDDDSNIDYKDKKDWMSSVQLWNTDDDCSTANLDTKRNHEDGGRDWGGAAAFIPFKMNLGVAVRKEEKEEIPVHGLTLLTPSIKNPKEESGSTASRTSCSRPASCSASNARSNFRAGPPPLALSKHLQQQAGRKQRRCWSPELHRRFVNALQQLGGSQVATPKQIRELMHVDGLTNDEVKSHLQKYRLHTRRPMATTTTTSRSRDQDGESSKGMSLQSGSPLGPLQLATNTGGTSTTGGDSMEEDEDTKSECYSWKRPCSQTRENRCIESLPTMNFADKEI